MKHFIFSGIVVFLVGFSALPLMAQTTIGELVRYLVDETKTQGVYRVLWDDNDDRYVINKL